MPCLASARAVALCAPSWTKGDETEMDASALAPAWGAAGEMRRDKLVDTRIPFRRSDPATGWTRRLISPHGSVTRHTKKSPPCHWAQRTFTRGRLGKTHLLRGRPHNEFHIHQAAHNPTNQGSIPQDAHWCQSSETPVLARGKRKQPAGSGLASTYHYRGSGSGPLPASGRGWGRGPSPYAVGVAVAAGVVDGFRIFAI